MPCVFNFLGQCHTTYRVLVPQPGIKPTPFALERRVLVTGPPGELLTALLSERTIRLHFPASRAVSCGHPILDNESKVGPFQAWPAKPSQVQDLLSFHLLAEWREHQG